MRSISMCALNNEFQSSNIEEALQTITNWQDIGKSIFLKARSPSFHLRELLICCSVPKPAPLPTSWVQVLIIWPNTKRERVTFLGHKNLTRRKKSFGSSWASAALCYCGYGNGAGQDLCVEDGRGGKLVFNFTKRGFRLSQGVFPRTPVHHNYRPVASWRSQNERVGGD